MSQEKADKGKQKDGKDKKDKKDKKGKKGKASGGASVAAHPRAAAAVRRCKGFGGLAGFGLAALLAHRAGLSPTHVVERALLVGVGGYLLAWGCAVAVWRHILIAELRVAVERRAQLPGRPMLSLAGREPAADAPPPPRDA